MAHNERNIDAPFIIGHIVVPCRGRQHLGGSGGECLECLRVQLISEVKVLGKALDQYIDHIPKSNLPAYSTLQSSILLSIAITGDIRLIRGPRSIGDQDTACTVQSLVAKLTPLRRLRSGLETTEVPERVRATVRRHLNQHQGAIAILHPQGRGAG